MAVRKIFGPSQPHVLSARTIEPKLDEDDSKNAIVEIRAGTGGLEASLFCADLFKMYEKVCSKKKMEIRNYKYF